MAFKQGETVNSIESNINNTHINIKKAVVEIREADDANQSGGNMLNKVVYIVIIVVVLLIILSWMMPK